MQPLESTFRRILLGAGAAAVCVTTAQAQIDDSVRGEPSEANHFIATPEGWEHPMTPWGEPDLRATLDMMQAAGIPLERCGDSYTPDSPACDMDKKWLTEEEYEAQMREYRDRVDPSQQALEEGDVGGAIQAGQTDPNRPQRQTNLIREPDDGLLPELTPEAQELAYEYGSDWALPGEDIAFDGPDDFDSWDRCITRAMPSMMMPYRYNGGFRIHQAPGVVVLETEMIHEARVVYTDGRELPDPEIQQYLGVSRGRWEGNTLVVETTQYRDGIEINAPMINLAVVGSPPGNRFPASDSMKTTERIVRLNDDTWLYEITTEDPEVLTEPFTVRYPMRHDPDYFWPEYACHEGNTIVSNYVETSRYERANPTPEPTQEPVEVSSSVADALAGRWVGTPEIATIDVDIELEFVENEDGTINGYLIGTNLGEIDKPLRQFNVDGRELDFTLPNVDPWNMSLELTDEGTLEGVVFSIQGNMPVTFERTSDGSR